MAHPDEEQNWIDQARKGDPEAVAWLYERFSDRIYRYVLLRIPDRSDAEDITEQVFVKMIETIPSFSWQGPASFSAWLYRIAHNLVIDAVRRSSRRPQVRLEPLDNMLEAESGDPHRYAERRDFLDQVRTCMGDLTDLQAQVLMLKYGAELSNIEVAEILGRTPDTVASVQYQALRKLHSLMKLKGYKSYRS